MSILRQLAEVFWHWIGCVAASVAAILEWFVAPRKVQLAEQENGIFALQTTAANSSSPILPVKISNGIAICSSEAATLLKGSRVELALRSDRFFFRAIEFPRRAAEFLDGIVRTQIDRITPWNSSEAVFGWSEPTEIANDRIAVTIAAAARAQIIPITQAVSDLGVKSIIVSTTLPIPHTDAAAIKMVEEIAADTLEVGQIQRALVSVFSALLLIAGLAMASDLIVGNDLRSQHDDLSRRNAERRVIIRAGSDAITNSELVKLERRKNQTPASVIVLEALSNILPDNTYVSELRIEGDKLQVIGISGDAPSLIRLIEQSPHFSRATFFAPTTRSPSDPGDRFHIEARIKPVFSPPS